MFGLDTNTLVRFLVRDDEAQHASVVAALRRGAEAGETFFVGDVVLAEVAQDDCGRIWLMGKQVVVLEAGRAVHIEHPLLAGAVWAFVDATRAGAVLADGRLVVEVVRECPEE